MAAPRSRAARWPRRVGHGLLIVLGVYCILRAAMEPLVIDFHDPTTYARDWGGPSLTGVLLVHMLPGVLALVGFLWWGWRHRQQAKQAAPAAEAP